MQQRFVSLIAALGLWSLGGVTVAIANDTLDPDPDASPQFLRPASICPEDVDLLIQGLLRDLPGYANRVARRTLGTFPDDTPFSTVLLAGRAELEPLPLEPLAFEEPPTDATQQVFFTTLERRYTETAAIALEQYHWLFLVPAADGWRLTLMFSRTAPDENVVRPPTPPRESSDGIMGQAIRLWLRDCRAGAIYPIEPTEPDVTER